MRNALSIARPSNQWRSGTPPTSSSAGVTRVRSPCSQAGSSPCTGSESTCTSSSRLSNPIVWLACRSAAPVAMLSSCWSNSDRQYGTVQSGLLQADLRLTPVSYIVLGLIELAGGEATPYRLKQLVPQTVGHFWTVQHAQLYSEPERLAAGGLLDEEREEGGRRRRLYRLTAAGRRALDDWRSEPSGELAELRAPGVLQLFFGADPAELAPLQAEAYRREQAELEAIKQGDTGRRAARAVAGAGGRASA